MERQTRKIRFIVAGDLDFNEASPHTFVDIEGLDECDVLLRWLGYEPDDFGYYDAPDLLARCRRRMWPQFDTPKNATLRLQTEALMHLAERAGSDGKILFS
jgi:hypothetical protein